MSFVYSHPFTGLANGLNTINAAGGGVGGWVELGRTTLGASGDTIDVTSLADKRYYMLLLDQNSTGGNTNIKHTINGDTGSNYALRFSTNGGTDSTSTSAANINPTSVSGALERFCVQYIANRSANEKLGISHTVGNQGGVGEANDPDRSENFWKWDNTSDALDQITVTNTSPGSYNTNSELVVLGWDPADTHTNNFWEELGSGDMTGGAGDTMSASLSSGKKYLWVQAWIKATGGTMRGNIRLGNSTLDTGTNYARRQSTNGGADTTGTSESYTGADNNMSVDAFINFFIINNSSNEKLISGHIIFNNTAGAATAPNREEFVGKWDNTSDLVDIVGIYNSGGTGDYDTSSFMKVWGSD